MGLKETINSSTLVSTSGSNNIDVHLQKNTEYGAMVLLGASNYGKRATNANASNCWMNRGGTNTTGTATNLATSTGNISGVYELGYTNMTINSSNWEWTAGKLKTALGSISPRYINEYATSNESSALAGDATVETKKWYGNDRIGWINSNSEGFGRGGSGVFSYYDIGGGFLARAAVVCGAGL